MRRIVSFLAITAAVATTSFAQEGTPPSAPAAASAPAATPKLSAGWTDADRSPEAIKRADAFLASASKAFRDAPTITENVTLSVVMPDGAKNEEKMSTAFGPKGAMRFAMDQAAIIATDGNVYFVPNEPKDKFVETKIDGTLAKTLGGMLPGFQMPTGALALREGATGSDLVAALVGPFLENPTVRGSRTANGVNEVLLGNDSGEAIVGFDAKTNLQKWTKATVSPMGAPEGMVLAIEIAIDATAAAELARPISFEKGARTMVASVGELGGPGGAEPEMKVKVGDVAPTAKLMTLDGKEVDIAALKGKVIVLDFWATWCGPCKRGLPGLQEFATSMKDNASVVVHPVNVWEEAKGDARTKLVGDFWTKAAYAMVTLIDPDSKFIEAYGFTGIPATVVIGADGKVAAMHVGFDPKMKDTLTKEVGEALAKK